MPDTFSPRGRLTNMANGEHDTTWGDITDANHDLLETMIGGVSSVDCSGAANITLTALNGVPDQSRAAVLKLTGLLTGSINVIVPTVEKTYRVINATTGAFTITVKTAAGSGVLVPQGRKMDVSCDGVNVIAGADSFLTLDVAGVATFRGAVDYSLAASIASAATTNIWATDGNTIHVTGSTGPITSLGTAPRAGAQRTVVFDGTPTLTNGGNLVLPTAANIVVAAGDSMEVVADTTTKIIVLDYMRADGSALTIPTVITSGRIFQSTDASAAEIVAIDLDRASPTPDNQDYLMALRWLMRDDGGGTDVAAKLVAKIIAVGAAVEEGRLEAWTVVAGALARCGFFGQGFTVGATATDLGTGIINAQNAIRIGNTLDVQPSSYAAKTGNYNVTIADRGATIVWTTAGFAANLPAANTFLGRTVTLINAAGSDDVTITPTAQTLDGLATRLLRPSDRTTIMSDGSNWFTIKGRYSFKSTEIAVDNASVTNEAHGLGVIPNGWRLVLRYKGAGELGYVANDEVILGGDYGDQASSASGVQVVVDATNVSLLQALIQVKVLNRTTPSTAVVITTADWKFELEVWNSY